MKKLLMFSVLLLLPYASSLQAYSVSYDQKVTVSKNTIANIKVVVQDEKMWAQSSFSGLDTIVLRNSTGAYSYMPSQKMATKIPPAMDRPNLTRDLPNFVEFLNKNSAQKTGSDKFDGKDCDIYKFVEPTLKKEATAWVWKEKNFPVKIEVPAPEGITIVELTNIVFDPAIKPGQFDLPKDVKVIDLESLQSDELTKAHQMTQSQEAVKKKP